MFQKAFKKFRRKAVKIIVACTVAGIVGVGGWFGYKKFIANLHIS